MLPISPQVGILKSWMFTNDSSSLQFVSNLWSWLGHEVRTAFCTRYHLTIFKPLLHLLSHLDHVFFVNAKKINDFISSWHTSSTAWSMVVEWSLQTLFCSMTFHPTTNSITHWFPVATCNENPLCFDGKVLFMGT